MNYKGFVGALRVDEEAGVLRGRVINTLDTITFQGKTVEEATAAFRDSVDDYLEFCESEGVQPEKPFSGKFVVRVGPDLHRAVSAMAQAQGVSVNHLVKRQLVKLVRSSGSLAIKADPSSPPDPRVPPVGIASRGGVVTPTRKDPLGVTSPKGVTPGKASHLKEAGSGGVGRSNAPKKTKRVTK